MRRGGVLSVFDIGRCRPSAGTGIVAGMRWRWLGGGGVRMVEGRRGCCGLCCLASYYVIYNHLVQRSVFIVVIVFGK